MISQLDISLCLHACFEKQSFRTIRTIRTEWEKVILQLSLIPAILPGESN